MAVRVSRHIVLWDGDDSSVEDTCILISSDQYCNRSNFEALLTVCHPNAYMPWVCTLLYCTLFSLHSNNVWSNTKEKSKQWPRCSPELHFLHYIGGRLSCWLSFWFESTSWLLSHEHIGRLLLKKQMVAMLIACFRHPKDFAAAIMLVRSSELVSTLVLSRWHKDTIRTGPSQFQSPSNEATGMHMGNTIVSCYFSMCDISDGLSVAES